MHALVEFLPQARDIGLHVILSRAVRRRRARACSSRFMRNLRDMGTPGILLSGSKDEGAVLGSVKMESLPPGRGRLVHRRLGSVLVQTAGLSVAPGVAARADDAPPGRRVGAVAWRAPFVERCGQSLRSTDTTRPRMVASSPAMGE